jgi:hypothetical protein
MHAPGGIGNRNPSKRGAQTHALDRAANGISVTNNNFLNNYHIFSTPDKLIDYMSLRTIPAFCRLNTIKNHKTICDGETLVPKFIFSTYLLIPA